MKKLLWILAGVILLITAVYSQSQYFWTVYIRTLLYLQSGATFTNLGTTNLSGTTTISGTLTTSGTTSVDSLNITGGITSGTGFWAGAPLPNSDPTANFQYFEDFIGTPFVQTRAAGVTADALMVAPAAGTLGGRLVMVTASIMIYLQIRNWERNVCRNGFSHGKIMGRISHCQRCNNRCRNIFVGLAQKGPAIISLPMLEIF
jgi:hypothetical protein